VRYRRGVSRAKLCRLPSPELTLSAMSVPVGAAIRGGARIPPALITKVAGRRTLVSGAVVEACVLAVGLGRALDAVAVVELVVDALGAVDDVVVALVAGLAPVAAELLGRPPVVPGAEPVDGAEPPQAVGAIAAARRSTMRRVVTSGTKTQTGLWRGPASRLLAQ
jgi:hypothetical protein